MRKVVKLATATLALVGAWKVASWMCKGTVWLLVNHGAWEPQAAAESAPWILFALCSGLAMCLYGMYEDSQQRKRSGPYGRVQHSELRNDNSRKAG